MYYVCFSKQKRVMAIKFSARPIVILPVASGTAGQNGMVRSNRIKRTLYVPMQSIGSSNPAQKYWICNTNEVAAAATSRSKPWAWIAAAGAQSNWYRHWGTGVKRSTASIASSTVIASSLHLMGSRYIPVNGLPEWVLTVQRSQSVFLHPLRHSAIHLCGFLKRYRTPRLPHSSSYFAVGCQSGSFQMLVPSLSQKDGPLPPLEVLMHCAGRTDDASIGAASRLARIALQGTAINVNTV